MSGILTYVLHYEGEFNKNSLGAVSEAAKRAADIGAEAHAVVVGENIPDDLAKSLGKYGAKKVYRANAPEGLAQPVVDVMAQLIEQNGYDYALFGGGLLGFEIGAGLAARKKAGVTMEVTEVKVDNGELVASRPILQDSMISESRYTGDLGVIIGRLNAFDANEVDGASAEVVDVDIDLSEWSTKARMVTRGEQRVLEAVVGDDLRHRVDDGLGEALGAAGAEDLRGAERPERAAELVAEVVPAEDERVALAADLAGEARTL